jgi:glycosyltransferase involved in cell wall biosynthesis
MFLPCGWIAARECDRRGVPFQLFGHGTDVDLVVRMPALLRARFLERLDRAEAVYLPSKNKLSRLLDALRRRDAPGHFRVQTMIESVPTPSIRRWEREPSATPQLLFVGRLIRQKGVDLLFEAAREFGGPVRVDLAGEGPERRRLEALARRLGVDAHFHGFVERAELEQLYAHADMLCVPSRELGGLSEGAPLVIPEALSFGVPVVASQVGGIPELCAGHRGCVLTPPDDRAALADAIRRVLGGAESSAGERNAGGGGLGAGEAAQAVARAS